MSVTRLIARPMLAAYFVADGIDAVRKPATHVERFSRVQPLLERAGVPPVLSSDAVMLTRVSGAISAVAGLCLATGRRPRLAALTLAVLNIPVTLVNNPVWQEADPEERKERARGLLRGLGLGGGLLLAAVDRDGKPSLGWRYENFLEHRADLRQARAETRARLA
ncbi:MAG: DoxX family protein [Actinomycetales bacterium]|nr:DoxX family protein [Actinomycetales bacterium]